MSHSIDISILWIEERDSDQKVLLAERIIPAGIMARSQVTLDIALLWSAEIWTYRILLTFRSSGSRKETLTRKCCLLNELFRQG